MRIAVTALVLLCACARCPAAGAVRAIEEAGGARWAVGDAAIAAAPLAKAAEENPDDPLPAEMLRRLRACLLAGGRLAEAADVNRTLLSAGRAHPAVRADQRRLGGDGGGLKLDGRADEPFWKKARAIRLIGPGPGSASVRLVSLPKGLAVAVRINQPAADDPDEPVPWSLRLAVDGDRDAWTQWVLTCDSSASRRLELRTHLAPVAVVSSRSVGLQAQRTGSRCSSRTP